MTYNGSQLLSTEPIVVSTYTGNVVVEDVRQGSGELAKIMATLPDKVYVVVDVRDITSSFAEVLKIIAEQSKGDIGTTTDPRLGLLVLVGTNSMAKLYSQAMEKRNSGVHIPMYTRMEDALAAVRMMIRMETGRKAS
jgi:hypothetical protein